MTGCESCKTPEPKIVIVHETKIVPLTIPDELIDTDPLPEIPLMNKQSDVANYVTDLWNSGNSCKEDMKRISKLQQQFKDQNKTGDQK